MQRLRPRDRWEVQGFLRLNAAHNAYLLGQVARGALASQSVAGVMVGYYEGATLAGVACMGSNLVLSEPCSPAAIAEFAEALANSRYRVRVIVGPDAVVESFFGACSGRVSLGPVALQRGGQLLFTINHTQLVMPQGRALASLRPADISEHEQMVRMDLAMVSEELGFDPFSGDLGSFRRGWLRRIREQRCWVVAEADGPADFVDFTGSSGSGDSSGRCLFKLDHSAVCDDVVQLAGVYTMPEERGRGLASQAVARMCELLLEDVPEVSLYVHGDNAAAIHVYRKLGFRPVGWVRSIWFEPR